MSSTVLPRRSAGNWISSAFRGVSSTPGVKMPGATSIRWNHFLADTSLEIWLSVTGLPLPSKHTRRFSALRKAPEVVGSANRLAVLGPAHLSAGESYKCFTLQGNNPPAHRIPFSNLPFYLPFHFGDSTVTRRDDRCQFTKSAFTLVRLMSQSR